MAYGLIAASYITDLLLGNGGGGGGGVVGWSVVRLISM